jgi:hypothetical protein
MFSSFGLSIPTNLVPTAVISVDNRMAAAMTAEPMKIGNELAGRSAMTARGGL